MIGSGRSAHLGDVPRDGRVIQITVLVPVDLMLGRGVGATLHGKEIATEVYQQHRQDGGRNLFPH